MQNVTDELDRFLESSEPGVVALKGDWGAGKTYFVRRYLTDRKAKLSNLVSFVSLFGLGDIEEVKRMIIPSAVIAKALGKDKLIKGLQSVIGLGRRAPGVSELEELFRGVENLATRNMLIVFDDIERKEETLSLKSFLGLVNYLSEHSNCKVLVVLNEDQLSDSDKRELKIFREKLLDREMLFEPSIRFNTNLIFGADEGQFPMALEIFEKCECRNLRIIKRCRENARVFSSAFKGLDAEASEILTRQVLLISALYYHFGSKIDFATIGGFRISAFFRKKKGEETEEDQILDSVDFSTSGFDNLIVNYLVTGVLDSQAVLQLTTDLRATSAKESIRRDLQAIYRIFDGNFLGSAREFSAKMEAFIEANLTSLSWREIKDAVGVLKSIGTAPKVERWELKYLEAHHSKFTFEQCRDFDHQITSKRGKRMLRIRMAEILNSRNPKDIIYAIARGKGWSREDIAVLKSRGANDYESLFRKESDLKFLAHLAEFAGTFNPTASDPECAEIGAKIFDALRRLARRDKFVQKKLSHVLRLSPKDLGLTPRTGNKKAPAK